MGEFREAVALLIDSARLLARAQPLLLLVTAAGGILTAATAWWVAVHYTRLWNLRFEPDTVHHASCAMAAMLTLLATISFVALGYSRQAATNRIRAWEKSISAADSRFLFETGNQAYHAVLASGLETFDPKVHYASADGFSYPSTRNETRRLAASVFLRAAIDDFRRRHPYLHRVIWKKSEVPYERVLEDREKYLSTDPAYPSVRYFIVASREILRELEPRTPAVVRSARRWLILFFLLAQAVPFALIGWAAYRDLEESY